MSEVPLQDGPASEHNILPRARLVAQSPRDGPASGREARPEVRPTQVSVLACGAFRQEPTVGRPRSLR